MQFQVCKVIPSKEGKSNYLQKQHERYPSWGVLWKGQSQHHQQASRGDVALILPTMCVGLIWHNIMNFTSLVAWTICLLRRKQTWFRLDQCICLVSMQPSVVFYVLYSIVKTYDYHYHDYNLNRTLTLILYPKVEIVFRKIQKQPKILKLLYIC